MIVRGGQLLISPPDSSSRILRLLIFSLLLFVDGMQRCLHHIWYLQRLISAKIMCNATWT